MEGFLGSLVVNNLPADVGDTGDEGSIPGSGRSLEKEIETPIFLPGNYGQRSLVGYSPWGHKESDMAEAPGHAGRLESEAAGTLPDASSQKQVPAQNKQGVGVVAPDTT